MLVVDTAQRPSVELTWTGPDGAPHRLTGDRPYLGDVGRTPLGENISCYVGVGGVRLSKGAGHPRGAVVRVGFYKENNAKPFFAGVGPETEITAVLKGVRFNQPVHADAASVVQHLKYDRGELQACGLPGDAGEQFNLASEAETLNERVRPDVDARLGVLDGSDDSMGTTSLTVEDDGTVTLRATFRYPVLRNLRDPWQSDLPGTFLEPYHFHIEFEALPEGIEPLPVTPAD